MGNFYTQTAKYRLKIDYFLKFIEKEKVKTDKKLFDGMCKSGCKNYNKKYSCPPFAPSFEKLAEGYDGLFVILFTCNLSQIETSEYNKIRVANSVLKSRMEKLLRKMGRKRLGTGACRLCKICNYVLGKQCKYPDKLLYSLEAVGIDCNWLSTSLFSKPLLWYKNKKAPEYGAVVAALFCDKDEVASLEKEVEKTIR